MVEDYQPLVHDITLRNRLNPKTIKNATLVEFYIPIIHSKSVSLGYCSF